jgi:hypothetical protein
MITQSKEHSGLNQSNRQQVVFLRIALKAAIGFN